MNYFLLFDKNNGLYLKYIELLFNESNIVVNIRTEAFKVPKSTINVTLNCDIEKVWGIVTSLSDYSWRSDISKIDIVEKDRVFIEYTKDLYPTTFTITTVVPYERYEFSMDNSNMSGYWIGIFKRIDNSTEIEFTEDVTAKKFYLKPFVKAYLKRQQAAYIRDLVKTLDE